MCREHAELSNNAGVVTIKPLTHSSNTLARTWVNGRLLLGGGGLGGGGGGLQDAAAGAGVGVGVGGLHAAAAAGGGSVTLVHNDRIRFGNNHLFRFFHPDAHEAEEAARGAAEAEADGGTRPVTATKPPPPRPVIDWEFAQKEFAEAVAPGLMLSEHEQQEMKACERMRRKIEQAERDLLREKAEAQAEVAAQKAYTSSLRLHTRGA